MEHTGIAEELNPDIHTGIGNPSDPNFRKLLTAEEERSVDDKGNKVSEGLLWGDSSTGKYLVVAIGRRALSEYTEFVYGTGRADIDLSSILNGQAVLTVASSSGLPRWVQPCIGACLEIPADLAEDAIKRQYVVEWLQETIKECMHGMGFKMNKHQLNKIGAAVADAANIAVSGARL
jgi:hypothetical protein